MKNLILGMCLSLLPVLGLQASPSNAVLITATTTSVQMVKPDPGLSQEVKPAKAKIFGFLKDINALNIILIGFGTFAGGLWIRGRTKLKQLADIFQKAYEYTDDKKLSEEEREDLLNRFLELLGKTKPKV